MSGRDSLPLPWRLLEAHFQRVYQVRPVDGDPDALLAYNPFRHAGPELRLQCGLTIYKGDPLLEVHFRRAALLPLIQDGDSTRMGLGLIRLADRDIPRLAAALEREPELREVKALHALTLFHRGVTRYGFEVRPVKERPLEWWFTWWMRLLLARDHAWGAGRLKVGTEALVVKHVWVSRETLIQRCVQRGWVAAPASPGEAPRHAARSTPPEREG